MAGALAPASLHDVAGLCLLEGCVGETLAALDAAEALASATDPHVRAALARIADDERRHAELAFRFVAWALQQSPGPGLRRSLAGLLQQALAAERSASGHAAPHAAPHETSPHEADRSNTPSDGDGLAAARLEAHGLLSEGRRVALRRAGLEAVVVPCIERLLAAAEGRTRATPRATPAG